MNINNNNDLPINLVIKFDNDTDVYRLLANFYFDTVLNCDIFKFITDDLNKHYKIIKRGEELAVKSYHSVPNNYNIINIKQFINNFLNNNCLY